MNFNKIIVCLIILIFSFGCATTKPEPEAYKEIMNYQKSHRYSQAAYEVFRFEAAYPNSKYLCELWQLQIDYYTKEDSNADYVKQVKQKRSERKCK
jgi:hypothetical protein